MFDICVTERCQLILANYISSGDTVIDCTAGGGSDTLFLAKCAGKTGSVLSFDVQLKALCSTEHLLEENGFSCTRTDRPDGFFDHSREGIYLAHDSHENLRDYFPAYFEDRSLLYGKQSAPSVIMYNLGYLPGGDHSIVTRTDSTLSSLRDALRLVKKNGVVSVVTYPGHEEGAIEDRSVSDMLKDLSPRAFEVLTIRQSNRTKAPVSYLILKK